METRDLLSIIEKFSQSGLGELKYREGSLELSLKKQGEQVVLAAAPAAAPAMHAVPHASAHVPAPAEAAPKSAANANTETITSPIVGTFYRSPAPDAPVFAEEGKIIKKGEPLCIIEAMKVMNALESEFDCEVVRILADNGKMVEYGTPLFEVIRK